MAPAVLLRAAVALTGRFPALAGVDLTVAQGEVVVLEGPTGRARPACCGRAPACCPSPRARREVLGCDLRRDRAAVRRRVGLLGHAAAALRRADRGRERPVRRARRRRCPLPASTPRSTGWIWSAGCGAPRSGACRPASAGGWRWPSSWPGVPSCGCSTSPTPGSTPPPERLLGELVAEAVAGGATVLLASHEPELAVPLADRVVSLAGGRVVGERAPGRERRPVPRAARRGAGGAHVA